MTKIEIPRRRRTDKGWLKFDLTVNLPLLVTLIIGFSSLIATVVKGYYDHDARLRAVELAQSNLEKSKVVETQGVILERIDTMARVQQQQKEETNARFNRLEDKMDRLIEGRKHQ